MHLDQRREVSGVAKIVGVFSLGEGRAVCRFHRDYPGIVFSPEFGADERETEAREITAAARTADDNIRIVVSQFHLTHGLLPDDGLMQQDVVEHTAEGVLGIVTLGCDFYRLADGNTETARAVRVVGENFSAGLGEIARACVAGRTKGFHEGAPVRLLVETDSHHEYLDLEAKKRTRQRK